MELDQKIRYAFFAVAAASVILGGLGLHLGMHLGVLDVGGGNDGL